MDVSIIIVNWNTLDYLRECLNSVIEQTRVQYEIFVVDNGSSDKSAEMVKNDFPEVKLIENKENRGFAAANNQAIPLCKGLNILLLNPDTKVLDHAIDKLVHFMERHPDVGAVTGKLLNSDGTLQKSVGNFYSFWNTLLENRLIPRLLPFNKFLARRLVAFWDHKTPREIDWARGALLMIRKKVVEQVGLLDEQFYIYGEEIDWCWRIKKAGWKIIFIPEAEVIHYGKAASNQRRTKMFIQNYKSFYIFLKKHYPFYSYYLYRLRSTIYIFLWLIKFSISLILDFKDPKKCQEAREGLMLYFESLKWHFSSKSFIRVR